MKIYLIMQEHRGSNDGTDIVGIYRDVAMANRAYALHSYPLEERYGAVERTCWRKIPGEIIAPDGYDIRGLGDLDDLPVDGYDYGIYIEVIEIPEQDIDPVEVKLKQFKIWAEEAKEKKQKKKEAAAKKKADFQSNPKVLALLSVMTELPEFSWDRHTFYTAARSLGFDYSDSTIRKYLRQTETEGCIAYSKDRIQLTAKGLKFVEEKCA